MIEVLTIGRVGVDIYPREVGSRLEDVETFGKFLGGSATNVAVAAARLGKRAAVITRTGNDPFGRFVHRALRDFGVDDEWVVAVPDLPTPVTFCEIFPPDEFPLYFYRLPIAPDLCIEPAEIPADVVRAVPIYWSTLTGLSRQPSRDAHRHAWEVRRRTDHTVIDLDYRPMFWDDVSDARAAAGEALSHCTIAIGNRDECEVAVGERDPERAAAALLDRGVRIAVVKQGPRGVLVRTDRESEVIPAVSVDVVNGLGAGDAFGGAFCASLLDGLPVVDAVRRANAAGAMVAARLECSAAMPTSAELDAFVEDAGGRR
ncbi:5-dehydro-2-deoxygluconokinase [Flexivirga sp. ID2601S]|uniref:5-dehydro-2-deoxygluconokinase n=1 Tax=Flexivirga aerilata TaxID=1656889 RepID=A0A849AS94_9MICO|nr:5-dehydro-2-deoxygluconokinase [Flexivirga aerilata]